MSFHPLAWGKIEPQKLASQPRPSRLRDKRTGWRGFGMSSQAKATQTWIYRMREMTAMYRNRTILARSISSKADLEVFPKLQEPVAAVLTHRIAVVPAGIHGFIGCGESAFGRGPRHCDVVSSAPNADVCDHIACIHRVWFGRVDQPSLPRIARLKLPDRRSACRYQVGNRSGCPTIRNSSPNQRQLAGLKCIV